MHSPSIASVLARTGLALLGLTAACSDPVAPELFDPEPSCPGTSGSWTATHGALSITMTLTQYAVQGWFGPDWQTSGTGRVARMADGLPLVEFGVVGGGAPCVLGMDLTVTGAQVEALGLPRPLLASFNAGIAWEPGGRVIRGTVSLSGTAWNLGPHPFAGVDTLVFRLR